MLPAGGSCLLGSINLSEFVTDNEFDFKLFRHCVGITVDAMNDALDEGLPLHPLEKQRECVRDWRQIGIGIFGLADMLIELGIKFGSKKACELCDKIGKVLADEAIAESARLAHEDGAYPKYNAEAVLASPFLIANTTQETYNLVSKYGLRNSQLLCTAPTGTLSSMLGISGGIEPIFSNSYTRKTESLKGHDEYYKVYTPIVKKYMDEHGIKDEKDLPDYFVTAHEINYHDRINMQAAFQKHIDASISSTVNLPNSATVEDVKDLYLYAWQKGLKGITIFRDGCKRTGILTENNGKKDDEDKKDAGEKKYTFDTLPRGTIIKADDNCVGKKRTITGGCGRVHIEAFFDPVSGNLLETYFSKGSEGGCNSNLTGLSRMISLAARGGVDVYSIVDQLESCVACPSYAVRAATKHDTSRGNCCPAAIGHVLIDMYKEMQNDIGNADDDDDVPAPVEVKDDNGRGDRCPNCGGKLRHSGGCDVCPDCGWSHCD